MEDEAQELLLLHELTTPQAQIFYRDPDGLRSIERLHNVVADVAQYGARDITVIRLLFRDEYRLTGHSPFLPE